MHKSKMKRILAGALSMIMVMTSGGISSPKVYAEEKPLEMPESSIVLSIPDDSSAEAIAGEAIKVKIKATAPVGSEDTSFVFVTDADVTTEDVSEVELSQKDRVFSFTLDNTETDAETEFTVGILNENAGEVNIKVGYGADTDAAFKATEEVKEADLVLTWTESKGNDDDTKKDESSTLSLKDSLDADSLDEEESDKNLVPADLSTENTTIEQFSATLKDGAALQDDGTYYMKPTDNTEDNTLVTYTVNYAISGSEDHDPGTVKIRIPAHLFKARTSTDDNIVWADKCTLSVPEAPATSVNGTFNYTYDEAEDEYVLTNYNTLPAASEGVFEFSYVINQPTNIVDMSASEKFISNIEIIDSKGTVSAAAEIPEVIVDTQVILNSVSKNYIKMSETWRDSWGEKPADASDYFYIIWRIKASTSKGQTQDGVVKVISDTLSDGGTVLGYYQDNSSYGADERALLASYDMKDNSRETSESSLSYNIGVTSTFYVLTKHSRANIPESGVLNITNTATVSVQGTDDSKDQQKSASSSYQYIDTGFKYIGDGEVSLTKTTGRYYYNTNSALTMLEKGLNVDTKDGNYPPFSNVSSVQGYAHTLKDGGDPNNLEDYGQKPLKVELIDDTLFLGDDFTTKLQKGDYEFSSINLRSVSVSELQIADGSAYENKLNMDADHEGWPDISLYGQFGNNKWVYLGKWVYNHRTCTSIYYESEEGLQNTKWYPEGSYTIVGGPINGYELYKNSGEYTDAELEERFPTDEEKNEPWYQISVPNDWGWGYNYFEPADIMKDHVKDSSFSNYWETYIYDNPDNWFASLPSNLTAVKASYDTTAYRSGITLEVGVTIKPSEHVLSIIEGKESVQLRNINTLEVYNSKGEYILDATTQYIGDGAKYVEQQDQMLYGRDAFHKTSTMELKGTSYNGGARKGTTYKNSITNDTENQRVIINYYLQASESIEHSKASNENIIGAGLLTPQNTGTFYDLLPKGVEVDTDSIMVSPKWTSPNGTMSSDYNFSGKPTGYEDYCSYTAEEIPNYNGTGRTMLIIHVSMSGDKENYEENEKNISTSTASGYQVMFKAYYPWDCIADYGKTLLNSMAYKTGNASITNGSPDDGGTLTEKDLMSDLDGDGNPEGTANQFLYDDVTTNLNVNTSAELSLSKLVKADGDMSWSNGRDDSVVVQGGGNYSYRLRFGSAAGTTTSNMIVFDSLENYTPDGVNEQWRGILKSIDTSQVESRGIDPVVYYSTVPGMTFDSADQIGTTDPNRDLTNTDIWSKEVPKDMSKITAIAVDMRKNVDGTDASLAENTTISIIVHMQAPTENLEHLVSEKIGAYNNIYLQDTLTTKAGTVTDQFINYSYTKVLLKDVPVEIHKSSDPETGTKESPAEVIYQGSLDYDVSVKNTSDTLRLTSLQIQDTIPEGLTIDLENIRYYYNEDKQSAQKVSDSREITMVNNGQNLSFDIQKLDSGSTIHFIIPTTVSKEAGTYVNTAHLTKVNGLDYKKDSETTYHFNDYGRLDIKKVDKTSKEGLADITFSLYKASVDENGNWTKAESVPVDTITTDQDGLGSFTKILPGTYLLYEDSMITGYYPVKEPWHVTVTAKSVTVVTSDGKAVKSVSDTYNGEDITRYIITNKKVETLPDTGSNTALLLTLLGLSGIAAYGIYETFRRRKRNNMAV